MTKKWRGTAPPGGVPCSGQRGNAGRVRCMHRRLDVARSGKCGREFAPSLGPWLNVMLASHHFLRPLQLLFSTGDHANSNCGQGNQGLAARLLFQLIGLLP
jgi:hypothetical protein